MGWHDIQTVVKTAVESVTICNQNVKENKWISKASTELINEVVNLYCLEWLGHVLMYANLSPNSILNDVWCVNRF